MEPEKKQKATIRPVSRHILILCLGSIVVLCIGAEIVLVLLAQETSEALLAIASTATGALAGSLLPGSDPE